MTLREAQALITLYQACRDEALRLRVLKLVPELGEFERSQSPIDMVINKDGRAVPLFGPK